MKNTVIGIFSNRGAAEADKDTLQTRPGRHSIDSTDERISYAGAKGGRTTKR